jgi:hypothetical protein
VRGQGGPAARGIDRGPWMSETGAPGSPCPPSWVNAPSSQRSSFVPRVEPVHGFFPRLGPDRYPALPAACPALSPNHPPYRSYLARAPGGSTDTNRRRTLATGRLGCGLGLLVAPRESGVGFVPRVEPARPVPRVTREARRGRTRKLSRGGYPFVSVPTGLGPPRRAPTRRSRRVHTRDASGERSFFSLSALRPIPNTGPPG